MGWERPAEADEWLSLFGDRLRELRDERGLTQVELAFMAQLDPTYISGIERGRRNLSLINIHVLALALGVSAADLLVS